MCKTVDITEVIACRDPRPRAVSVPKNLVDHDFLAFVQPSLDLREVIAETAHSRSGALLIAYADTGFLVSLYGLDSNSAMATSLVTSKPVFLLTSLGEAEFANAVELRVFRREWTRREARAVRDVFQQYQAVGVFRPAPLGSEIWEKALVL
jgi:hypothetical protein